jgi:hypothetical protein
MTVKALRQFPKDFPLLTHRVVRELRVRCDASAGSGKFLSRVRDWSNYGFRGLRVWAQEGSDLIAQKRPTGK